MTKIEMFRSIIKQMAELYEKKNSDYGSSFDATLDEYGLIAPAIRLSDKLNRFKTLIYKDGKVNESLEDTLLDLANYSIMTLMWIRSHDSKE